MDRIEGRNGEESEVGPGETEVVPSHRRLLARSKWTSAFRREEATIATIGMLWLLVGVPVLCLFVARLWASLPPDPAYRRRLGAWLAAFAAASLLYAAWINHIRPRHRPGTDPPLPVDRYRLR